MIILSAVFSIPAVAVSEAEVSAQVAAAGREAVSGNLFIWFLCAIAFLKISQKIDSFMSSLGINVGHTGGSMIAELMIAARGVTAAKNVAAGGFFRNSASKLGGGAAAGAAGMSGFLSGGLVGAVGRQVSRSVANSVQNQGSGIGAKLFASSVQKGGGLANNVVSSIANGAATVNSMTGDNAAKALASYLGGSPNTANTLTPATFSDVEIRGGQITGIEVTADNPSGTSFGMYNADRYMKPDGSHSIVEAVDGSKWYKQYAADTVEKTPYLTPDGSIAYNESLVNKLPKAPMRKGKL